MRLFFLERLNAEINAVNPMINLSLLKLLLYRLRGATVVKFKSMFNIRGLVLLAVIFLFIGLAYQVVDEYANSRHLLDVLGTSWKSSDLLSLGLLISCLVTVLAGSRQSLSYSSEEIDFLFTAPIDRKSLITYKYLAYAFSSLLSALFIAAVLPTLNQTFLFSVISLFLTLLFVQTTTTTLNLFIQILQRFFINHERMAWIYANITLVLMVVYFIIRRDETCPGTGSAFVYCPILKEVLYIFQPVAAIYSYSSPLQLTFNILLILTMIVTMFLIIVKFEGRLRDELYVLSLSNIKNWNTMKKTGLIYRENIDKVVSHRAPKQWGSTISLGWIQALAVIRNSRNTLIFFSVMAIGLGALIPRAQSPESISIVYPMLYFLAVFILPRFLVFDFRGSLEIMESLRSLPASPWAICAGFLLVPILITSAIEFIVVLVVGLQSGVSLTRLFFLLSALVAFNTILYVTENLIFLLFPSRLVPVGRVDFDFLGRTLLEFVVKSLIIFVYFGITLAAIFWSNKFMVSSILPPAVGFIVFLLMVICLTGSLVRAFNRFDTSRF